MPTRPSLRNLPPTGSPRRRALLRRAVRLQCPECGASDIFKHWLSVRDRCPRCDYAFSRESGYFLGAQNINLAVAELVPVTLLVVLLVWSDLSWIALEAILIPTALLLPLLLYPFACSFWMAFDLWVTPMDQN